MNASLRISLVVPLHDEEANVEELVREARNGLSKCGGGELILVDDGSTDSTGERIRDAADRHENVRAIGLRRQFGKGAALAAGIEASRGILIATIDGDLQEDPEELGELVAKLDEGYDLVSGWREDRQDSLWKRLQSKLFRGLVRVATGRRYHDINCGFKVMRRTVADELMLTGGRFRFVPLYAEWWGFRTVEVPVRHRPRRRGRSSFGSNRFPGALFDLFAVSTLIRFHNQPGQLFIGSGAITGTIGFMVLLALTLRKLIVGDFGNRYPLLMFGALLVIVGVQLVAAGVLAEWLVYDRRESTPGYRVGWTSDDESSSSRTDSGGH